MDLPVYGLFIDESAESDLEVNYVALVDKPAIEKNFLAFKEAKPLKFNIDNEKRIISGPAMLADQPIYRNDDNMGEYLVVFSAATIYQIVQKFFSKNFNSNFNLSHDPNQRTEGVTVFESFIVDSSRGIKPMVGFEDAKDGSWFISAKVNNEEVWRRVKSGEFKGFSVEGMFEYKKVSQQQHVFNQIKKLLEQVNF